MCIAARRIPRGKLILREKLLFSVESLEEADIKAAVDTLSVGHRVKFYRLASASGLRDALSIFETNGFRLHSAAYDDLPAELQKARKVGEHGLFLQASRLNHSSKPNACFNWNPLSEQLTIRALRVIEKGEEITLDYLVDTQLAPPEERYEELGHYELPHEELDCFSEEDNAKRSHLRSIPERVREAIANNPQAENPVEGLLGDLEAPESVYPSQADICEEAKTIYWEKCDRVPKSQICEMKRRALQFGEKALEQHILATSEDSCETMLAVQRLNEIRAIETAGIKH